jgi:hypothetical protein
MFGIFTIAQFWITFKPLAKGDIPDPYLLVLSLKKIELPNITLAIERERTLIFPACTYYWVFPFFLQVCDVDTLG